MDRAFLLRLQCHCPRLLRRALLRRLVPSPMISLAVPAIYSLTSQFPSATTHARAPSRCACACVPGRQVAEQPLASMKAEQAAAAAGETPRFRWDTFGSAPSEPQWEAIRGISPKLPNRCRALMARLVCLPPPDQDGDEDEETLGALLVFWVKAMKPKRTDWLLVLKELTAMESPLLAEVSMHFRVLLLNLGSKMGILSWSNAC